MCRGQQGSVEAGKGVDWSGRVCRGQEGPVEVRKGL